MQKLLCIFYLLICSQIYSQQLEKAVTKNVVSNQKQMASYLPNTIIIKFKTPPSEFTQPTIEKNQRSSKLKSFKISSFTRKFPTISRLQNIENNKANKEGSNVGNENFVLDNIYELKYEGDRNIQDVINEILKDSNVIYAEPSYICHPMYNPNDPSFSDNKQAYLEQIKTVQGWDVIHDASDIIIAIIDSGTDLLHEDLQDNLYLNKSDPINGMDDDNDGFIDNYYGWDFAGPKISSLIQDNNPGINNGNSNHGIHVSGIASAVTNNKKGIASVATNAKLMIVKVTTDDKGNDIIKGYEGIKYAVDHGAKIINCSWGSTDDSEFGQDIINYAIGKGCLIVAAAGNNHNSEPIYPAAYKGVLAVANVQANDVKNSGSNFGSYVSISAPGTDILSTFYGNHYGNLSGTSMAAPLVSSAAALVKSHFPNYSMVQIGQQLRVTADNIDDKNPNYTGELGKGRLNVYTALTKTQPSIRSEKITLSKDLLFPGDTVYVYSDVKNYLAATKRLSISLTSTNASLKVLDHQIYIGEISTLESKQMLGPFRVVIGETTPSNSKLALQFNYRDPDLEYDDFERFTLNVNLDYLPVNVNKIITTMTSNGRIGYSQPNATHGFGFRYKGKNLLYEGSLMIGNSSSKVSNNVSSGLRPSEDFTKSIAVKRISSVVPHFEGHSEFSDAASANPLGILVRHRQLAYTTLPDEKYSIAEYKIVNNNNFSLDGIYIGLFTDWDLGVSALDVTKFDPSLRVAYAFGKHNQNVYAGVKLLSTNSKPAYFPLSNDINDNPLANGFAIADKFESLSSGIKSVGLGDNSSAGLDISFVSGYGPFKILPGDSVTVAFAFIAGDDYMDLQNSAKHAQTRYDLLFPSNVFQSDLITLGQNYPNPFKEHTFIEFSIPSTGTVKLNLFTLTGIQVNKMIETNLSAGNYRVKLDRKNMPAGVYIYSLQFNSIIKSRKMMLVK
jgi:serine protease